MDNTPIDTPDPTRTHTTMRLPVRHAYSLYTNKSLIICWEKGVKTKPRAADKPGVCVTVTDPDACIKVAAVDFGQKGASRFLASLAATSDNATLELHLDSPAGDPVGTLKIKPTGDLEKWDTQSTPLTGVKGIHDLYLKFTGPAPLVNVDWWKCEQ